MQRRRSGLFVPAHLGGEDLVPAHHIGAPEHQPRRMSDDIAEMSAIAERHRMRASLQSWKECVAYQRAAGTLFNTYTVAKSVINADALWDMPRNWMQVGRQLELVVTGAVSNIVTTPGLMNFQLKIGGVAAFDTGNIQLNATAHVTLPFMLYALLTCRSIGAGAAATLIGLSDVTGRMFTLTAGQSTTRRVCSRCSRPRSHRLSVQASTPRSRTSSTSGSASRSRTPPTVCRSTSTA
jgi:hypothetical protein